MQPRPHGRIRVPWSRARRPGTAFGARGAPGPSRFTLIELLVVIAIIAALASLLLPTLSTAKDTAYLAQCTSTLRGMLAANALYAGDQGGFSVHGNDVGGWGWGNSGFGRAYYWSLIYDDDWGDATLGIPGLGRNGPTGEQNICGVGQLMLGGYLPDKGYAVACPQVKRSEPDKPWGGKVTKTVEDVEARLRRTGNGTNYWGNWRDDLYVNSPSYEYNGTNYVTRGPLMRLQDGKASKLALFADGEMDWHVQSFKALVFAGASPLIGWSRTHAQGFNTGYLDGHVALFKDPERRKAFFTGEGYNYGSGSAMFSGALDGP